MEHTTGQPETPAVWERPLPWLRENGSENENENENENGTGTGTGPVNVPSAGSADSGPDADSDIAAPSVDAARTDPVSGTAREAGSTPGSGTSTEGHAPVSAPGAAPAATSAPAPGGVATPASSTAPEPTPDGVPAPAPASRPDIPAEPAAGAVRGLLRPQAVRARDSGARGAERAEEAQPERGARMVGAVVAAGALLVLGLGGAAFMVLPSDDDPAPHAAAVGDGAVPQLAAGGSARAGASPSAPGSGRPTPSTKQAKPGGAKGVGTEGSSAEAADPADTGSTAPHTEGTHTATGDGSPQKSTPAASAGAGTAAGDAIAGYGSSKCIEVSAHAGTVGSPLRLWGCDGKAWQKWVFTSDGSVRSMGLCLAIAGSSQANGASIRLATCNGGWAQRFNLNTSHDLVNTVIGKCVDAKDQGTGNGTPLQLWDCGGTSNQKWYLK